MLLTAYEKHISACNQKKTKQKKQKQNSLYYILFVQECEKTTPDNYFI